MMVMIRMIIILIEHIFASPMIISMSVSFISPLSLHLVYTCSDSSDQLRNAETFKHSDILLVNWERLKCKTALKPGFAEQRIEQA